MTKGSTGRGQRAVQWVGSEGKVAGPGVRAEKMRKGGVAVTVAVGAEKGEEGRSELNIVDLRSVLSLHAALSRGRGSGIGNSGRVCIKFLRLNDDCGSSGYIIIHLHLPLRP
jgi:hypothetical protein